MDLEEILSRADVYVFTDKVPTKDGSYVTYVISRSDKPITYEESVEIRNKRLELYPSETLVFLPIPKRENKMISKVNSYPRKKPVSSCFRELRPDEYVNGTEGRYYDLLKNDSLSDSISKIAYELYKEDWIKRHTNKEIRMSSILQYYVVTSGGSSECQYTEWIEEFGYCGNIYASYQEFYNSEYQDNEYISYLFSYNQNLISLYHKDLKKS